MRTLRDGWRSARNDHEGLEKNTVEVEKTKPVEEREREMDDVAVGLVVSSVLSIRKGGTPAYMRADTSEKATVQPKHMEAAQCRWLTCSTTRWTSMQPEKTDSFLLFHV